MRASLPPYPPPRPPSPGVGNPGECAFRSSSLSGQQSARPEVSISRITPFFSFFYFFCPFPGAGEVSMEASSHLLYSSPRLRSPERAQGVWFYSGSLRRGEGGRGGLSILFLFPPPSAVYPGLKWCTNRVGPTF